MAVLLRQVIPLSGSSGTAGILAGKHDGRHSCLCQTSSRRPSAVSAQVSSNSESLVGICCQQHSGAYRAGWGGNRFCFSKKWLKHMPRTDRLPGTSCNNTRCEASASGGSRDTGVDSDDPQQSALKIEQLEAELELAVRSENYQLAAQLRDRLRLLQEDIDAGVLAANALFYRAFAAADLRLMRRVWARGDHVQCLHPGTNCISGYDLVMASWDAVLGTARDYRIDLEDVRVHASGSMAFVTCVEVIRSAGGAGRIVATNVFEREGNEWRMCLHHGSQAPTALFA